MSTLMQSTLDQNQAYQEGLSHLREAEATGNSAFFVQAQKRFMQLLNQYPRAIEPHLSLIYLFILIADFEQAERQIKQAEALDAAHPQLLLLKQGLKELQNFSFLDTLKHAQKALAALPSNQSGAELDSLFDSLEKMLLKQIQALMERPIPRPSLNEEALSQAEALQAALEAFRDALEEPFAVLDRELDITPLKYKMRPFLQILSRLEKSVAFSRRLKTLQAYINQTRMDTFLYFRILNNLPQDQPPDTSFFDSLETLYDACDAIADALDELSEVTSISELEPEYEQMLTLVYHLQSAIDGT